MHFILSQFCQNDILLIKLDPIMPHGPLFMAHKLCDIDVIHVKVQH